MWLLEYDKALRAVLEKARAAHGPQMVPLTQAFGLLLADDVRSDVDLPPFDRAMMDGFAVKSSDIAIPPVELEVTGRVGAGEERAGLVVEPGCAVEIMTGAPVPRGADAVIQVEKTSGFGRPRVRIDAPVTRGQSISPRAAVLEKSSPVLRAGQRIDVAQTALLAAVGCDPVPVARPLKVAIISTGDEIVPHAKTPGVSQIRDVCGPALAAAVRRVGCLPRPLGIVGDDPKATRDVIARGLACCDVLLLTGGVSAGARDHVAAALFESGVELHFERLAIKPGKPTVFGTRADTLVFGLPGNPVSAMVTFELFVAPACLARMGAAKPLAPVWQARLTQKVRPEKTRTWFLHGRLRGRAVLEVEPVASPNSADIVSSSMGDCLIAVPPGAREIPAGTVLDVIVIRRPSGD